LSRVVALSGVDLCVEAVAQISSGMVNLSLFTCALTGASEAQRIILRSIEALHLILQSIETRIGVCILERERVQHMKGLTRCFWSASEADIALVVGLFR
jgi:hypothetical protein